MTTYTLKVSIPQEKISWLRANGYKLCLAKRTADATTGTETYNTVWIGDHFDQDNTFKWTETYAACFAIDYQPGSPPKIASPSVEVQFGQTIETTPTGLLDPPKGAVDPNGKSFTIVNNYTHPIHVGVKNRVNGEWQLTYISPSKLPKGGSSKLTPINHVAVWFQANVETGTVVEEITINRIEVDYNTGPNTQTVSYEKMGAQSAWSLVQPTDDEV